MCKHWTGFKNSILQFSHMNNEHEDCDYSKSDNFKKFSVVAQMILASYKKYVHNNHIMANKIEEIYILKFNSKFIHSNLCFCTTAQQYAL